MAFVFFVTTFVPFVAKRPAASHAASAAPAPAVEASPAYTYTVAPFLPEYDPPAPGSYELPVIDEVSDHAVVDSRGARRSLHEIKKGRLAVLALVYTSCPEPSGCPLAGAVLQRLDRELGNDPALAARVRLISLSFDPERDTVERLARVRALHDPRTDWIFLTTPNDEELQPVLDDLGQQVAKLRQEDGSWSGLFRHVLKVYLLDEENRVRNIYSAGFLHAELVLADLHTLIMQSRVRAGSQD